MIQAEGARLSLSGPLTIATVAAVAEAGREQLAGGDRVVDLSGVTQVDSAALALLLSWQRSARAAGHQLSIDRAPTALVSLASLYDVDSILSLAR